MSAKRPIAAVSAYIVAYREPVSEMREATTDGVDGPPDGIEVPKWWSSKITSNGSHP
jgi:hypothetical protein